MEEGKQYIFFRMRLLEKNMNGFLMFFLWGLVSHVTINATGLLRRFPEFPSFGWEKNIVRKSEYCVCGNQKA